MTAMSDTWAAIEIGCSTCQQNSRIIGVYRDVDAAIAAADQAYDDHGTACSQYTTEVHRLPVPQERSLKDVIDNPQDRLIAASTETRAREALEKIRAESHDNP